MTQGQYCSDCDQQGIDGCSGRKRVTRSDIDLYNFKNVIERRTGKENRESGDVQNVRQADVSAVSERGLEGRQSHRISRCG